MEWAKDTYNSQYESWMPWIEDMYLRWFTKDNKVSYTAKRKSPTTPSPSLSSYKQANPLFYNTTHYKVLFH